MSQLKEIAFEELTWAQARREVKRVNTRLCEIIDKLDPPAKFKLYRAAYPYGSELLRDGQFLLPRRDGSCVPFTHSSVPKNLQANLAYNNGSNPAAIVLRKSFEFFISVADRIIPYVLLQAGDIFGLSKALDLEDSFCPRTNLWGLTAGARSVFMLPKISESGGHNRLRKSLGVTSEKPRRLQDHWPIFVEISTSDYIKKSWDAELMYFSGHWFMHKNDPAWLEYNYYLLEQAWRSNSYWRNQYILGLVFSANLFNKGVEVSSYIVDLVKHLLAVGVGELPGLQPALDNRLAPIQLLQQAYIEEYGLKRYVPTIMQPGMFDHDKKARTVYCSLQYPTSVGFAPRASQRPTTLVDLYNTGGLLKHYLGEIREDNLKINHTPFSELVNHVNYELYHTNVSGYQEVNETSEIFTTDSAFSHTLVTCDNNDFPKNSSFLNGCVQVSKK